MAMESRQPLAEAGQSIEVLAGQGRYGAREYNCIR